MHLSIDATRGSCCIVKTEPSPSKNKWQHNRSKPHPLQTCLLPSTAVSSQVIVKARCSLSRHKIIRLSTDIHTLIFIFTGSLESLIHLTCGGLWAGTMERTGADWGMSLSEGTVQTAQPPSRNICTIVLTCACCLKVMDTVLFTFKSDGFLSFEASTFLHSILLSIKNNDSCKIGKNLQNHSGLTQNHCPFFSPSRWVCGRDQYQII